MESYNQKRKWQNNVKKVLEQDCALMLTPKELLFLMIICNYIKLLQGDTEKSILFIPSKQTFIQSFFFALGGLFFL